MTAFLKEINTSNSLREKLPMMLNTFHIETEFFLFVPRKNKCLKYFPTIVV